MRLRWATLLLGAVAAAGLAEQHHHPAPVIRALSGSTWPSDSWSVWTLWFTAASLLCLGAVVAPLSQRVRAQRAAAVLLSSALWSRGLALFLEYRWDLWGTVVQIWFTALVVVSSWSWGGSMIRSVDRVESNAL